MMGDRARAQRLGPPQIEERKVAELRGAMRHDQDLAGSRGEFKRIGKSGRLTRQVHVAALMNAVDQEGRDVLSADAEGYWKDMDRRHPWIKTMPDKCVPGMRTGRTRFGRSSFRKVYTRQGNFVVIGEE